MATYKDVDAILSRLPQDLPYKASVKRVLIQAPTADVVPRAEMEGYKHNWQKIHDSYTADCIEHYNRGRSEVARAILQDIAASCATKLDDEDAHLDFAIGYYTAMNEVLESLGEIRKKYEVGK